MIALAAALASYWEHLRPLPPQRLPLAQALGLVLAEAAQSQVDLPLFTQSAVDGYALRSTDTAGATKDSPVRLKLVGEIPAGAAASLEIPSGCAARIFTGGRLPATADTSARQEIVEREGDHILLRQPLRPGADTRFLGEEVRRGDALAEPGQRLHSGLLAALAMAGIHEVMARPRPRIAVIITGDEVAESGQALEAGQIHDANGPLIQAWLRERGHSEVSFQRVRDERDTLKTALKTVLDQADVVLSSGGVSVGDRDYIPGVAEELGLRKVFWKVAQKPGKPLWFGVGPGNKALLAFPGNPAAVLIGLHLHAARLLGALEGAQASSYSWNQGALSSEIKADAQRDQLVRVAVSYGDDGRVLLQKLSRQDSHMLSNLATAEGLAWLPRSDVNHPPMQVVCWLPLAAVSTN